MQTSFDNFKKKLSKPRKGERTKNSPVAKTEHYYTRLEPGKIYHVYNRIVGDGNLFTRKDNYEFFLRKFDQYLSEVVQMFAYSLLPNHFHLMIRVQPDLSIPKLSGLSNLPAHEIVSAQFKKFFPVICFSIQ